MSRHVGSNPTSSAILLMKKALLVYNLAGLSCVRGRELLKVTLLNVMKVYVA